MGKDFKKTFLLNLGVSLGVILFLLIVNFVISYCDKNKSIKIKEIINPVKKKKLKYKNEVIVSCVFK